LPRSKLKKFQAITALTNVIEPSKEIYKEVKGFWQEKVFKNSNPIVLEIGCGYGEYTVGLAEMFPHRNFVGIDIKGERIWQGAVNSFEKNLGNAAFLRAQINRLPDFFKEGEAAEIWITFPDPRPRDKDIKRRLTSQRFLEIYKQIAASNSLIHLKTDNLDLFNFSYNLLKDNEQKNFIKNLQYTFDLYDSNLQNFTFGLQTRYEKLFLPEVKTIKYLQFQFT